MSNADNHARDTAGTRDASTPAACRELAAQMLGRLREHGIEQAALYSDSNQDTEEQAASAQASFRLPVDEAIYAIRLAYCLAPHFGSMEAVLNTTAFVTIKVPTGEDANAIGQTFAQAAWNDAIRVVLNPQSGLRDVDRFVVLSDAAFQKTSGSTRAIATAAQRGLAVFSIVSVRENVSAALAGVDFDLVLPAVTPEMLSLLFEASHTDLPAGVTDFLHADAVRTEDLVAHFRRGRPAAVCLAGLQQAVTARTVGPAAREVLLADLAGYGEAKTWGLELAQDMKFWREGRLAWNEVDHRAVVLAGVPGTGKTSFAGVLAATLRVPLIATSVAEWNGRDNLSGALKGMQAVFEQAIAQAPAVLFIDELDGISSRSAIEGRYSEYWTQIVNRMLELVTQALGTEGLVIVGATNHVDRIDPALMRSGRLDQIIRIELPNAEAISAILRRYAGPDISCDQLSELAPKLIGSSGADIEKMVRAGKAMARRAGRVFSANDLRAQLSDPLEGLNASTRRRIAIYRRGQRMVAQILGLADLVIEHQNEGVAQLLTKGLAEERFPTEQTCDDVLTVIMGGRAAEEIVCGDISVYGAGSADSDLAAATAIALEMELKTGSGELGLVYLQKSELVRPLSMETVAGVRRRLDRVLARASALLLDNLDELERGDALGTRVSRVGADHLRLIH